MKTTPKDNIIKTEKIDLNFYAVRNKRDKWLRRKGYSGYGESWVDDITQARIYSKPGPAKAQVTFWGKHYPKYGIPDLVRITTGICEYIDQTDRVTKVITKHKLESLKQKKMTTERKIKSLLVNGRHFEEEIKNLNEELAIINDKLEN